MIPELGLFLLITAILACMLSLMAAVRQDDMLQLRAVRLSSGLVFFAFSVLAYSFYEVDLSVQIVYQHVHHTLPALYRIGALWGGHEGSMLLWSVILNLWMITYSGACTRESRAVLSAVSLGFLMFLVTVSNPFARYLPITPHFGQDLNPFLQDPVMLIHPPILYTGYLGFIIPFALSVTALWRGTLTDQMLILIRQTTLIAWSFLTLGIALGSFWAYYELGWGGWWFWDPVENASLLPWIAGAALLHISRVTQLRGGFKAWTLLLCIMTFSLSILGTFLVRSGALTSVHSFANDPTRGLFILCLLALYTLPALALYSMRAARFNHSIQFSLSSREGLMLINNVLFMICLATVLLGTLYPLIIESFGLGFISVGAPYFNALIVPLGLLMAFLMGFAPFARYMKSFHWPKTFVFVSTCASSISGFLLIGIIGLIFKWPPLMSLSLILVFWIISQSLLAMIDARGKLALRLWGMHLAHLGFASLILGIAVTSYYSIEDDVILSIGDSHLMREYEFTLEAVRPLSGPNYTSAQADLKVMHQGEFLALMQPEKRFYTERSMPIAQIALEGNLARDIYVALAEPLPNNQWILRIQYKPMVRFIWLGAVLMALGAMLSLYTTKRGTSS